MQELGLPTIRDVENLIISSIYEGIIRGKLNSEKQQFIVEETLGRDVRPHEIDNMVCSYSLFISSILFLARKLTPID